jgi:hypothetical protein
MKRYTLRMLIHDAKVFNQLRRDYRQAKKKQEHAFQLWMVLPILDRQKPTRASLRK